VLKTSGLYFLLLAEVGNISEYGEIQMPEKFYRDMKTHDVVSVFKELAIKLRHLQQKYMNKTSEN